MARSLDERAGRQEEQRSRYSQDDAELATRLGIQMLNEGNGMQVIKEAMNSSKDPAQAIGAFLAQMMGSLAEKLQAEAGIDPGVFLAKNGFLEAILNYIEKSLGLPPEFSDQVYPVVLETIKAAAQNPPPAAQGAPPQGGPSAQMAPGPQGAPAPQAAPPQGMGGGY